MHTRNRHTQPTHATKCERRCGNVALSLSHAQPRGERCIRMYPRSEIVLPSTRSNDAFRVFTQFIETGDTQGSVGAFQAATWSHSLENFLSQIVLSHQMVGPTRVCRDIGQKP